MKVFVRLLLLGIYTELRLDVIADINHKLYSDFSGADNWEVFPDVHPTLEEVKAAGISLGVVSNFDDRLGQSTPRIMLTRSHLQLIIAGSCV